MPRLQSQSARRASLFQQASEAPACWQQEAVHSPRQAMGTDPKPLKLGIYLQQPVDRLEWTQSEILIQLSGRSGNCPNQNSLRRCYMLHMHMTIIANIVAMSTNIVSKDRDCLAAKARRIVSVR